MDVGNPYLIALRQSCPSTGIRLRRRQLATVCKTDNRVICGGNSAEQSGPQIGLNTDLRIVYWELQLLVRQIFLVIAVAVLLAIALPLTRSAAPVLDLQSPATTLGQATPITVHVRDPRGVRSLAAFVEQNAPAIASG